MEQTRQQQLQQAAAAYGYGKILMKQIQGGSYVFPIEEEMSRAFFHGGVFADVHPNEKPLFYDLRKEPENLPPIGETVTVAVEATWAGKTRLESLAARYTGMGQWDLFLSPYAGTAVRTVIAWKPPFVFEQKWLDE